MLPQWHVKDPGYSAKSAGGRLHLNMHTPLGMEWVVTQVVRASDRRAVAQVRFPGAARDKFFPESTLSADSLSVFVHPRVQSHALTSVRTIKIL